MIPLKELQEALEKAEKATRTKLHFIKQECSCYGNTGGFGCECVLETSAEDIDPRMLEFLKSHPPDFAKRLIQESLWMRGLLVRARSLFSLYYADYTVDDSDLSWLRDYEKGPTNE